MSYKKALCIGTENGKFGKYRLAVYDHKFGTGKILDNGCCVLYDNRAGYGSKICSIIRKVYFDCESQSIILDVRRNDRKNFRKRKLENITNKEFFRQNSIEKDNLSKSGENLTYSDIFPEDVLDLGDLFKHV